MNIYPVIVIYNRKCLESPSCTKLLELGYLPVIVDNSTADFGNENFCRSNGMCYISMHGNAGLPKAYNAALNLIRGIDDGNGLVIWLDDDTELNSEYFSTLEKSVADNPETDIFVPVVYGNAAGTEIISPSVRRSCKHYRLANITPEQLHALSRGEGNTEVCSAINSGMCVRLNVYDSYSYDNNMFLDYVDHEFMYAMGRQGRKICVMFDASLHQGFFGLSKKTTFRQIWNRDRIFINDFRIYEKKAGNPKYITEAYILKQSLYKYYTRYVPETIQIRLRKLKRSILK